MKLQFKSQESIDGYQVVVNPENSPLRLLTFGKIDFLGEGRSYEGKLGDEEAILTLLLGQAVIEIEEKSGKSTLYKIGPRNDPFIDRSTLVYIPPRSKFMVTSVSSIFKSTLHQTPVEKEGHPLLIEPSQMNPESTGVSNWRRNVTLCTPIDLPIQRLIMGQTINPPGNWSSYPPHKHDEDKPPSEAPYEEIYHFLVKPEQGFGFIRLYDPLDRKDRMDEAFVIQNGDTIVLPRGYHPLTVAPGYQLLYLFALAGDKRKYGAWSDDPNHEWIRSCESILKG